jgi:hypothetical protein
MSFAQNQSLSGKRLCMDMNQLQLLFETIAALPLPLLE